MLKVVEILINDKVAFEFDGTHIIVEGVDAFEDYEIPFDKNGKHATGRMAFDGKVWWSEYADDLNEEVEYLN